jgi:uncharacterized protein (TIGR00288 family)
MRSPRAGDDPIGGGDLAESQIGVLIDYENVGLDSSVRSLFDQLSDIGRVIIKRAYADWSKAPSKGEQMLGMGIEARHYFRTSGSGKNASDICLAIDAIDLLHRSPVDTFVIVSSDTDFIPLVSALRSAGKTVIGVGRRGVVSPGLVHSCDRYIFLEDGKPAAKDQAALQQDARPLVQRAIAASVDEQGQVLAAKLHNTILRMDPSFDFRSLEYRSFTQFLAAQSPLVRLVRPRGRGDVLVELGQSQQKAEGRGEEIPAQESWDVEIDAVWGRLPGTWIAGSKAAAEAAKVLGASKLSASRYKSLQVLLDASELLRSRWSREGNAIRRRTA